MCMYALNKNLELSICTSLIKGKTDQKVFSLGKSLIVGNMKITVLAFAKYWYLQLVTKTPCN